MNDEQLSESKLAAGTTDTVHRQEPIITYDAAKEGRHLPGFLKKKPFLLVVPVLVVAIIAGVYGMRSLWLSSEDPATKSAQELLQVRADDSEDSQIRMVKQFGPAYGSAIQEVQTSDTTQWDKTMLDKAYLSLIYADKVGAFTQVNTMLAMITLAQNSGLDIDDNSYGVTQSMRDDMKQRADALAQQQVDGNEQ